MKNAMHEWLGNSSGFIRGNRKENQSTNKTKWKQEKEDAEQNNYAISIEMKREIEE